MRNSTPLRIATPMNASSILDGLQNIGAHVEYATERTVDFIFDGARMKLGHNWDDDRFITVVSMKDRNRSDVLVRHVKRVIEPHPIVVAVNNCEIGA